MLIEIRNLNTKVMKKYSDFEDEEDDEYSKIMGPEPDPEDEPDEWEDDEWQEDEDEYDDDDDE